MYDSNHSGKAQKLFFTKELATFVCDLEGLKRKETLMFRNDPKGDSKVRADCTAVQKSKLLKYIIHNKGLIKVKFFKLKHFELQAKNVT